MLVEICNTICYRGQFWRLFCIIHPDSFELSHAQLVPDSRRSSRSDRQLRQGELQREGDLQADPPDPRRSHEKQPRRLDKMGGPSTRKHAAQVMQQMDSMITSQNSYRLGNYKFLSIYDVIRLTKYI